MIQARWHENSRRKVERYGHYWVAMDIDTLTTQ